jgi:hypothetical protein
VSVFSCIWDELGMLLPLRLLHTKDLSLKEIATTYTKLTKGHIGYFFLLLLSIFLYDFFVFTSCNRNFLYDFSRLLLVLAN